MTMHDNRKNIELEEARKAGHVPAEVDENGKEINPHIPHCIAIVPWYINTHNTPSLSHQKKRKSVSNNTKCDDRGGKTSQTDKNRKNACQNCGAMTHDAKSCLERPRKVGAKRESGDVRTSSDIASDKKRETSELTYDGKRDRWDGYNVEYYSHLVMKRYEKNDLSVDEAKVDEAKVDESKQMDFAKVEKRVCTTGGGSTGTVRNLRLREDTAKYLWNLDVNSAHYDPKTRSMREDPLPDAYPNEKFYEGDNQYRNSGQALEYKELNMHTLEAFDKGQDVHIQAAPSQAEFLYKNFKIMKEKLKSQMKETILEKYGNAADWDQLPRELLLGQSERQVEYDRAGRIIKGQKAAFPRSKYEEDILINNHATVWGSWWNNHQWGYKCCMQTMHNSYCTGAAGIEAAETANMKNFRQHFRRLCR